MFFHFDLLRRVAMKLSEICECLVERHQRSGGRKPGDCHHISESFPHIKHSQTPNLSQQWFLTWAFREGNDFSFLSEKKCLDLFLFNQEIIFDADKLRLIFAFFKCPLSFVGKSLQCKSIICVHTSTLI